MTMLAPTEGQTVEWKREWTERVLEDLAAFANTDGVSELAGGRARGLQPELLYAGTPAGNGLERKADSDHCLFARSPWCFDGRTASFFPQVTVKTIQRDLQALVDKGLVNAEGEKKGRRYVLAR